MRAKNIQIILYFFLLLCIFTSIGWSDTIESYLTRTGVLIQVEDVEKESPFYGLLFSGDILIHYDGILMQDIYAMVEYLYEKGGEEVKFLVVREGEHVEVSVPFSYPVPEILGIDFQGIHNPHLTDDIFQEIYNKVLYTMDDGDELIEKFLEGEITYRDFFDGANEIMTRFLLLSQFNAFTRDAWANIRDPERVISSIYKYDVFISLLRAQFAAHFLEILLEDEEIGILYQELLEIGSQWSDLGVTVKP